MDEMFRDPATDESYDALMGSGDLVGSELKKR